MKIEIIDRDENFFCVIQDNWIDTNTFIKWFNEHEDTIQEYLLKYGVIRFKKTGLKSPEDFQKFISNIHIEPLYYVDGNSPRTKISSKVYTSTEYPSEVFISMHNELSYSNYFPKKIFFYCLTPALSGGETTVLNGITFLQKLNLEIMQDFFDRNIIYIRNLHGGKGVGPSWQETFETNDKEVVEKFCTANQIKMIWKKDDSLRLEQIRPTTLIHPALHKKVWFNQADQFHPSNNPPEVYEAMKFVYKTEEFPLYVNYEDGTDIPESIFAHIREVAKKHLISIPWEKEDIMLVDNLSTLHGRNPFSSTREILVSMS